MRSWIERQNEILQAAKRQLFFVGGAPRSGTTWLQYLLDAHPEVSCRGEGLFWTHLAGPLAHTISLRRDALAAKNNGILRDTPGYPLPLPEDTDFLLGTAILLALAQQAAGNEYIAIGEKTPENVYLFPQAKCLFPGAKLITIMRDPRDVLASSWHFFCQMASKVHENRTKARFFRVAITDLNRNARAVLAIREKYPSDSIIVTYEEMSQSTAIVAALLFRFLGVSDAEEIVAECVERASFFRMSGGRSRGETRNGTFFRSGVVGDWHSTVSPEVNALVLQELGWMFPLFDWVP